MKSLRLYRVLKKYPKAISNSGRMVFLEKGSKVHLKPERHVMLLVKLGYLKELKQVKKVDKSGVKQVQKKKPKKTYKKKQYKKEENKIDSEEPLGDSEEKLTQE